MPVAAWTRDEVSSWAAKEQLGSLLARLGCDGPALLAGDWKRKAFAAQREKILAALDKATSRGRATVVCWDKTVDLKVFNEDHAATSRIALDGRKGGSMAPFARELAAQLPAASRRAVKQDLWPAGMPAGPPAGKPAPTQVSAKMAKGF